MMLPVLTAVVAALMLTLLGACWWRARQRARMHIPAGYRVLAADLGYTEAMGRAGAVLLRDNEWGLAGKVDLVLDSARGAIPVEYKRTWAGREPGQTRPSHMIQHAANMLLCQGDSRVNRPVPEGWLRYVDARGRVVPGGEVRIPNTPELRAQVIRVVERMRQALVTGEEVHRSHRSVRKCAACRKRDVCGEEIA